MSGDLRVAIVGAGLAGTLLAWRLGRTAGPVSVTLFAGAGPFDVDATGASGGLVRGFETDPALCLAAAESLAEIRASRTLRDWSGYREVGSVYLLPRRLLPIACVRTVERLHPGSARVLEPGPPFVGLPAGTVAVVERHAGFVSPARLRRRLLAGLAGDSGRVVVRREAVTAVTPAPGIDLCDGRTERYDVVVVAAGPWTPRLLEASGLPDARLRTRHVQYLLHPGHIARLPAFVDEVSGLYGRPTDDGGMLLGLPSGRWDVPPRTEPDRALAARSVVTARRRFAVPLPPAAVGRTVAAADCYADPPGLALRAVAGSGLFTFTGGSGGAAKTALAASRAAATALRQPLAAGRVTAGSTASGRGALG